MLRTKVRAVAAMVGVLILGAGAVVTMNRARAEAPAADRSVREKAAAREKAAVKVTEFFQMEQDVGNVALTPSFVELKSVAARRLVEARIENAEDPAERIRAAEQYVVQCQNLLKALEMQRGQDVISSSTISQARYFLADAEYLVAKLRAVK